MATTCAGCHNEITRQDNNYGEFWYGIPKKEHFFTGFTVQLDDQHVSILGHQKLYFCPDCLRIAQQNCQEAQNALDQFAIALRKTSLGMDYHYFTRRDFMQMQFGGN